MIVTIIAYAISLYFMPLAFRSFRDLQYRIEQDLSYLLLQPGVFNTPTGASRSTSAVIARTARSRASSCTTSASAGCR